MSGDLIPNTDHGERCPHGFDVHDDCEACDVQGFGPDGLPRQFDPPDDDYGPSCARCGGDCERVSCEECGGEGATAPGELYDMDPLLHDEDETQSCHQCGGVGGWWVCGNSEAWCVANPRPGCEGVARGPASEDGHA